MRKKQKKVLARILIALALLIGLNFLPVQGALRFFLFLIPYLVIGYDILRKAVKGILNRQVFDENFLMAVATLGAFAIALYDGSGDFNEAVAVMLFYQVGELFQSIAVGKSRKNISELMDIRPDYANIEQDGHLEQVDPDEVEIGTVIVVQPGEKVPIDGVVLEGNSSLNTSALTGESVPRDIAPGEEIISGCINMTGLLKIRTTKEFGESTVSKILEMVENSTSRKSRSENFISKFAKYYTPAVCYSALALAVLPPLVRMGFFGLSADWTDWIYRALTFLVISCPCALVISIPLSFFAGIGGASREGVLVKGSNFLEALSQTKCVVFDKTGTLTQGVFEVNAIHYASDPPREEHLRVCWDEGPAEDAAETESTAEGNGRVRQNGAREQTAGADGRQDAAEERTAGIRQDRAEERTAGIRQENVREKTAGTAIRYSGMDEAQLLEYAALAESASSHPISRSLLRAYAKEPDLSRVSEIEEHSGKGVTARVDGHLVAAGNDKLMALFKIPYISCSSVGTIIHVAVDGTYMGHVLISDRVKATSAQALAGLKDIGISRTVMLTGDAKAAAEAAAHELGVDEVYSELLPGDKVEKVEELLKAEETRAKLAFVGDGINDAPVLGRADIGIAMGAMGSDAAIEAADVVLMDDDPLKIVKAIKISRKCLHIVYENIVFALGVKAVCLLLGALGIANMWLAIFADVGVMILAVLNAIRALFVKNL